MSNERIKNENNQLELESTRQLWIGGEARTWAPLSGTIGAGVGLLLGLSSRWLETLANCTS